MLVLGAGTALHVEGRKPHRRRWPELLSSSASIRRSSRWLGDPTTGDEVRRDTHRGRQGAFGFDARVDDGQALFDRADRPPGLAAVRLWELVTLARVPSVSSFNAEAGNRLTSIATALRLPAARTAELQKMTVVDSRRKHDNPSQVTRTFRTCTASATRDVIVKNGDEGLSPSLQLYT